MQIQRLVDLEDYEFDSPIVFRPFFPKVGKQSQPYELVSILTSTIYIFNGYSCRCIDAILGLRSQIKCYRVNRYTVSLDGMLFST